MARPRARRTLWQRLLGTFDPPAFDERPDAVLVVGLGRFGTSLAHGLLDLGIEVLAVDVDADLVQRSSKELPHVLQADTTDTGVLEQLGTREFSVAVVAIGSDVEASVITVASLLDLGIPNVWAKATSERHATILRRIGAHHVVLPEHEMGARVAHAVSGRAVDYFALDEGFALVEVLAPKRFHGKTLLEAQIRATHRVTVVCVKPRGGRFTYATPDTPLGEGDLLVIAGQTDAVEKFETLA